jgi:hypothetical protein
MSPTPRTGLPMTAVAVVRVFAHFEPETLAEATELPFGVRPSSDVLQSAWQDYHHQRDRGLN